MCIYNCACIMSNVSFQVSHVCQNKITYSYILCVIIALDTLPLSLEIAVRTRTTPCHPLLCPQTNFTLLRLTVPQRKTNALNNHSSMEFTPRQTTPSSLTQYTANHKNKMLHQIFVRIRLL